MKNKTIIATSIFCLISIMAGIGCVSFSDLVTPARIDQRAVSYASEAGIADANDFIGYQNLEKALRLEAAVSGAHQVNQLAYEQMAENDRLEFDQLTNIVVRNRSVAQEREQIIFGEKGLLSLGLSMAGFGTLTGMIGLLRKRPSDVTEEEFFKALESADIKLEDKDRQLFELVKGVQAVLDTAEEKDVAMLKEFKKILGRAQNKDTKTKVAEIKSVM